MTEPTGSREALNDLATPFEKPPRAQVASPLVVRLDSAGRLQAKLADDTEESVIARRSFPWSKPGQFLSLRNKEGKELLFLNDLDAVSSDTRTTLLAYLEQASFVPKIVEIQSVVLQHGYMTWMMTTDRGPGVIRVQEREDVRHIHGPRFSVKDADGNVYEIPDVGALNEQSKIEFGKVI